MLMLLIVGIFAIYIIPKIKRLQQKNDRIISNTRENLAGIKTIKSFGSYDYHGKDFKENSNDLKRLNLRVNSVNNLSNPAVSMLLSCLTIGIYWIGAYLIKNNTSISYSALVGYASLAGVIVNGFLSFIVFIVMYPQAQISGKRVLEVINCQVDIKDGKEEKLVEGQYGKIEFNNVNYHTCGSKANILTNISFSANTGETIAFVGPTGSGKTTLINLIMRFIEPNSGNITIDGNNIKKLKLTTLRKKIGYVPQRANLLNRTISDNIGLTFDKIEQLEEIKIKRAGTIAQAEIFINNLEQKYATNINEDATNLSGGQKQRISIARAIVDNPEFLLFDDSFSALDYITDAKLRNELNTKYKKSTKIIITNRISSLTNADKIHVIDKGKIIASGKHTELLSTCTLYGEMVTIQEKLKGGINE
jgi:ATP-binding cassette subfamily B protein